MRNYLQLIEKILKEGTTSDDRTGTGTIALVGEQIKFDLAEGFPLVTTRKIHVRSLIHELLWFIRGSNVVKELNDVGVTIWDEWAKWDGTIGPGYGVQWRRWATEPDFHGVDEFGQPIFHENHIDQLAWVINEIKRNPTSRRLIVSAWNVGQLDQMALPPCHLLFQFVVKEGKLHCILTQRSWDVPLGGPYNIAQYALLTHMIAHVTDLQVGTLTINSGDTHIYMNQILAMQTQLTRTPHPLPSLWLNPEVRDIDKFTYDDIKIQGYKSHPHIPMEVSV